MKDEKSLSWAELAGQVKSASFCLVKIKATDLIIGGFLIT